MTKLATLTMLLCMHKQNYVKKFNIKILIQTQIFHPFWKNKKELNKIILKLIRKFKISIVNMTQTYSPWLRNQKATEHKSKINRLKTQNNSC